MAAGFGEIGTVLSGPPFIAIIDDDGFLCDALANLMRSAGFEATTFNSGDAFLARACRTAFDVILTDYQMPGTDGLELVKELRSRGDKTPVIVMTAQQNLAVRDRALRIGANEFLLKPFDADTLIEMIERMLSQGKGRPNGAG